MTALVLIWGPLYVLVTGIVTLIVYWVARKFTDSRWPLRIVIGLAIAWPVGDVALTRLTLMYNCAGKSGAHIYRTVENVAGFFSTGNGCDGGCLEPLIRSGYAFYEARVGELKGRRNTLARFETSAERYEEALVPGPGLYRFTREEPGHPNCEIYDSWFAKRKGLQKNEDYKNNCIATWKIDEVSSKYRKERYERITETFVGDIRENGYLFRDIETEEILAENTGFVLNSNLLWSLFLNPHVCRIGGGRLAVFDVLKPVSDQR